MLSCCLILKNEINNIEKCIVSIQEKLSGIVNDIVVVDTGSTDGTRELVEELGCRVYDFEWVDDFAKARNCSINHAKNDWIFIIDGDEYIESVNIEELRSFIKKADKNTLGDVERINIHADGSVILEEIIVRIFNKKQYDFHVRIHERLRRKKNNHKEIYKDKLDILIMHTGYAKEIMGNKEKDLRNVLLIEKELERKMVYDLYARLGSHYYELGEINKATKAYEDFILDKECAKKDYFIGTVKKYQKLLLNEKLYNKVEFCQRVWEKCCCDDEYVYNMGILYSNTGDNNKAVECFINCVNKEGETIIPKKYSYYPLGSVFEQINDLAKAIQCYKLSEDFCDAKLKVIELQDKLKNK